MAANGRGATEGSLIARLYSGNSAVNVVRADHDGRENHAGRVHTCHREAPNDSCSQVPQDHRVNFGALRYHPSPSPQFFTLRDQGPASAIRRFAALSRPPSMSDELRADRRSAPA